MIFLGVVMILGAMGQEMKPKAQSRVLKISIEGVPVSEKARIDATYSISPAGFITMWKIGKIDTKEKTSDELEKGIAAAYQRAEIYDRPIFKIVGPIIRNGGVAGRFVVGGHVRNPGSFAWKEGGTLGEAIGTAGGATPYGATGRVKLYRNGRVYVYNLGVKKHGNVKIYRGDLIEVQQKNHVGK